MSERTDGSRVPELDGLRGWAALGVFVWHAFEVFHPALIGGPIPDGEYTPDPLHRLARVLPIGAAFNGLFAVYIFFALSGFVLTHQLYAGRLFARGYLLIARRWLRLLPVVAVGSALGFVMLAFDLHRGLNDVAAAGNLTYAPRYEPGVYGQLTPWGWVRQTFGTVWAGGPSNELFNRVLWTIGTEFQCSVLVYAGVVVFRPMRNRPFAHLVMGFAGVCLVGVHYLPFAAGVGLADWWHARPTPGPEPRWRGWLGWGLVAAAVWAGGIHPDATKETWLAFRSYLPESLRFESATNVLYAAAAGVLVHAALTRPLLRAALRTQVSRALGFVSYPLYAVHQPLLYVVAPAVFVALFPSIGYTFAAVAACGITFAVSSGVAAAVAKWVDEPANRVVKTLVRKWAEAAPGRAAEPDPAATPQPAATLIR